MTRVYLDKNNFLDQNLFFFIVMAVSEIVLACLLPPHSFTFLKLKNFNPRGMPVCLKYTLQNVCGYGWDFYCNCHLLYSLMTLECRHLRTGEVLMQSWAHVTTIATF